MVEGLMLVIAAAILQGVFLLPMARARDWAWEHIWLAFSLCGMILGNWLLAFLSLSHMFAIYASVPRRELIVLVSFGVCWGVGAILFGVGMEIIGLALGYPVIMGLNASVGTLVPLLGTYGLSILTGRGLLIVAGTATAIAGIAACSVAGTRRESPASGSRTAGNSRFLTGLIIAVVSGVLSCLPNIGFSMSVYTLRAAREMGVEPVAAGNAVWFIFFTSGGIVNVLYCFWLMRRHRNLGALFARDRAANWRWGLAMGAMWIGSFCLYGMGIARMGVSGATIGWPILVSLSIGVGVMGGLARGEWNGASRASKTLLWQGLAMIILAVLIIPFGTGLR